MEHKIRQWLEEVLRDWKFNWSNLRTSIELSILALLILGYAFYLNWPLSIEKKGDYFFSLGYSLFLLGIFSIIYEARTRKSFRDMLGAINPNIESGVTVHPSHGGKVLPHKDAIEIYLIDKAVFRLRTSTADGYVVEGEKEDDKPTYSALVKKIEAQCTLKILLYLPIFQDSEAVAGRHGKKPSEIIQKQKDLLTAYKNLINKAPKKVNIKFFFSPLHVNFFMLGDNRMYSSLIPNGSNSGISKSCFEIFPTGSESLFFRFQKEFDDTFKNDSLEFEHVASLLTSYSVENIAALREAVLTKIAQIKTASAG